MKLELLTLCDYAKGETSGKLYIIGIFDRIYVQQTPGPSPNFAIAARLRFEAVEKGVKTVVVSFVDSDGGKVIPDVSVQMNVEVPPGESTTTANVVVMLPPVNLPCHGEYSIDLAVDARLEGSVPLYVQRQPPQALASRSFPAQT